MKRITFFILLVTAFTFVFTSCNNQDEPEPDTDDTEETTEEEEEPEISDAAKSSGETVKTDEDSQAEKEKGEQTVSDESVESTSSVDLSDEALAELEALTGESSDAKIAGAENGVSSRGWFLAEINGEKTTDADKSVYFFSSLGYYFQFYLETQEWDWSVFYVNDDMSYMVLDLNHDTRQQKWDIQNINKTKRQMTVIRDDGDSLLFKAFVLDDFAEKPLDADGLKSVVASKELYRAYDFRAGVREVTDTATVALGTGFDTLFALNMKPDFTFETFRRRINFSGGSITGIGALKKNLRTGVWEILNDGKLKFTYDDNDEIMGFNINVAKTNRLDVTGFVDLDKDGTPEKVNWLFVNLERLAKEWFPDPTAN